VAPSKQVIDAAVIFLSAAGGAMVGAAMDAWWWVAVGVAALGLAAWLLARQTDQNELDRHMDQLIAHLDLEDRIGGIIREELPGLCPSPTSRVVVAPVRWAGSGRRVTVPEGPL
jgi:hypothetical protein